MRLALEADEDDSGPSQADAMFVEHLAKQLREDKLTIKDRGNPPPSRRHTRGGPMSSGRLSGPGESRRQPHAPT